MPAAGRPVLFSSLRNGPRHFGRIFRRVIKKVENMVCCTRRIAVVTLLCLVLAMIAVPVPAAPTSHFFTTSDGVRLHYLEAGAGPVTIVFVPGWTMPAEIWEPQIRHFATHARVIALDPRAQGRSEIARAGYTADRRAQDIKELLDAVGSEPVVLVGWSLGVLESLAYVKFSGTERLRALVLVDNSIGEEPPPVSDPTFLDRLKKNRAVTVESFVRHMYRQPQSETYYRQIIRQSLRVPLEASIALLSYSYPREFWKQIVYQTDKPVLYVVNARFREQALNLRKRKPEARIEVFEHAGHALFVDEAERFNKLLGEFIRDEGRE
jgi:microsomal epoxide hydrolase